MSLFAATQTKTTSWPINVGAEGIAAAQFARCGFDVLVQSGHDKPWYDLVITKAGNLLKVSVKFKGVSIDQLPRIYLASPSELALRMRDTADRLSHAILYEQYEWTSPESGARVAEALPSEWLFSLARIQELLSREASEGVSGHSMPVRSHASARTWSASAEPRSRELQVVLSA